MKVIWHRGRIVFLAMIASLVLSSPLAWANSFCWEDSCLDLYNNINECLHDNSLTYCLDLWTKSPVAKACNDETEGFPIEPVQVCINGVWSFL